MSARLYPYVGPEEIRSRVVGHGERHCIRSCADLRAWIAKAEPNSRRRDYVPATFVVDSAHLLWIADRRSEHVACADGGHVLAAGELVISEDGKSIAVIEATNQSTGYCPEPECWTAAASALDSAGIARPRAFTRAFEFRKCGECGSTNLIKEDLFECAVCGRELSRTWNFDESVANG